MDVDPHVPADFRSLQEITEKYEVIAMLDVIEHLQLQETMWYLDKFKTLLATNGLLILSTPDPSHPTWIREDISHIQHYPYRDFIALLKRAGYPHIEVYRILNLVPSRYNHIINAWIPYIGFFAQFILTHLTGINFESRTLVFVASLQERGVLR